MGRIVTYNEFINIRLILDLRNQVLVQ